MTYRLPSRRKARIRIQTENLRYSSFRILRYDFDYMPESPVGRIEKSHFLAIENENNIFYSARYQVKTLHVFNQENADIDQILTFITEIILEK
jgi:hypothetical protein